MRQRRGAALALVAVLLGASASTQAAAAPVAGPASVITVDASRLGEPLKKAGLGTLFGITTMPSTPKDLAVQTQLYLSQHMENSAVPQGPAGTPAAMTVIGGTDVRMVARFNDLMGGNPWYQWSGLDAWLAKVDAAARYVQPYKDQLFAVAPFNEPDNKLHGLENDTTLPGSTYDAKFNHVWTQTVRHIRAIDPSLKIMGPNWEFYLPWQAAQQAKMRDFLANAISTGTTPDLIGWHNLGASPGDVPEALKYFRPLEEELKVPGRPLKVVVEEYGPQTNDRASTPGNFEGVPGTMVQYWADLERRDDIVAGSMGVYNNPGTLGNTLRPTTGGGLGPNGGWFMMRWYKQMTGAKAFVSRWDTRGYLRSDGLATWDPAARSLTVLAGGEEGNVDVRVQGLGARGLTGPVRVQLDVAVWTKDAEEAETRVDRGGDIQTGPLNLVDKTMTVASDGTLTVPIRRMERYSGYRVVISPVRAPDTYPSKYEAESATLTGAVPHLGSDTWIASGRGFVGGIDGPSSAVTFTVDAPRAGIYVMTVRYANGTSEPSSHTVQVGGRPQGSVTYAPTPNGWSPTEMRTTTKRVLLAQGSNAVRLGKGDGFAELDFIDVRPDTHRYEAESATVTQARRALFWGQYVPDFVGGIDSATSAVDFAVDAPSDGTYRLTVGYGNGTGAVSTHAVVVNGTERGVVSYQPGRWLSTDQQDHGQLTTTIDVPLRTGVNHVVLRKGTGFAELDYLTVAPVGAAPPPTTPPPTTPPPTTPPPTTACTATYRVTASWAGGYQADVSVSAGSAGVSSWTLRWTLGPGQSFGNGWNGQFTTSGRQVTVTNETYNGAVAPGTSVHIGLVGSADGAPTVPAVTCGP